VLCQLLNFFINKSDSVVSSTEGEQRAKRNAFRKRNPVSATGGVVLGSATNKCFFWSLVSVVQENTLWIDENVFD
jgi:hypothetical protein